MGDQVNDPIDLELQLLPSRGSGARQTMQRVIRVVQCVQMFRMFLAGTNHERILPFYQISSSKSIDSSPEQYVPTEAVDQCVNSDQTAPLLDDTRHSRKLTERLIHVLHSIVAFKTNKTSEGKQEVEASDSLATSSDEHRVTIDQTTINQITVDQLHVSTIVHQKNFLELEKFGGLRGVESALCTDLINGISKIEAENRRRTEAVSINLAPTHTFFQLISKEVKKTTIALLLLAVTVSTVFEINEEGLKYGWCDGVIVLIAIILQVLVASIRKYMEEKRTQKRLHEEQFEEREVLVKREGNTEVILESELVWGDLVLLKKCDEVPCDGLFVDGEELLELDRESESCIINEQNPFLSYGEKVINGDAIILVTSTNMKTEWGEMMSKAMGDSITWFKFEKQLDMLNTCMHVIQFIISILIVLVLAFRFMVGKIDDQNVYRPESFAEPTRMRSFGVTLKNIINEPTYRTKVLIKLLGVSLVGLTEGVPFVVSLAIVYWNDKILVGKGTEQDPNCVTKMAFVTRICTNDSFITGDKMEVEKHFIGGEFISELVRPSHNIVNDALRDGIGTLNEKQFFHVKEKFGCNKQKGWKILKTMGAKSLEEPCAVLMKGTEESEDMVWQFNGPVKEILDMCKHYYDLEGNQSPLDDEMRQKILQANQNMEHEQLMTIAFACKRTCEHTLDVDNFSLIALLGLKNIKIEDTYEQIREFKERGIETVIVSSKKISVLRDKCEFGGSESLLITGEVFRNYSDDERLEKVDNIRLLCEARPSDKLLLVETMMKKGLVVAYVGHRTDEAPALIKANIGVVAMGTLSSKHVKGNCDIIIGDESFAHLINMVDCGKNIYYNIQSFLQIVLSMFINCNLISILEIVAYGDASLTVFQLAWVTYAMSFLGGLALLTKPSTDNLARHYPISCGQSVITVEMIRNIISQTLYLIICTLIIHLNDLGTDSQYNKGVVSNIIIFCQFFNLFIAREPKKKNFFKGIHRHREFWVAIALFIVLHAGIDMVQDVLGYGTGLKWKLWVGCVLLSMVSWLVDWLGKCISGFIITFVYKLKGSTNMMKNLLRI